MYALGELADVGADGGREQQRLVRVGHLAEDPLDVGPEPDVEHPVGLVEDDVEDVAQVERAALDVVDDAAGGADDDVDAALQSARSWRLDRLAAVDAADGDVLAVGELLELGDDLLDEFAGRGQDDRLGTLAAGLEHLDQRDAERGRLAGARLGLADDVVAFEGLGDQLRLDWRRRDVADLLQSPQHRGAKPGSPMRLGPHRHSATGQFDGVIRLQVSADGREWPLMRLASFPKAVSHLAGPMCCRPSVPA